MKGTFFFVSIDAPTAQADGTVLDAFYTHLQAWLDANRKPRDGAL